MKFYNNFIFEICQNHIAAFAYRENKRIWAVFLHFLLPVVIMGFLTYDTNNFKEEISTYVTAFSIFIGLLLNLLVLIFGVINLQKLQKTESAKIVLRNLLYNVLFGLLISISAVFLILCIDYMPEKYHLFILYIFTYLMILFVLILYVILNRLSALSKFSIG